MAPHDTRTDKEHDSEDPAHHLTSLKSTMFGLSSGNSSMAGSKQGQPAGLSQVLRAMQLDDYQIKPDEIEIMTNLDGSPATLGRGAFGEVKMHTFLDSEVAGTLILAAQSEM